VNYNADLGEITKVLSGAVGNTKSDGEVKIKKNSLIPNPGFVKARKISVDNPSTVPNRILAPVTGVTLPAMQYNTASYSGLHNKTISANGTYSGNYNDITIKKNVVCTLTGSTFHNIKIEDGAQVTFTASTINMNKLEVGTSGGGSVVTRVKFSTNTDVRVKDRVEVDENCQINPTSNLVVFYMDGDFDITNSKKVYVTASIYAPKNYIDIHGNDANAANTCYMTGRFIAKKVHSEKNVTWNNFNCAAPPAPPTNPIDPVVTGEPGAITKVAAMAYPNPSENYFNIRLTDGSSEEVTIRVIDMSGKVMQVVTGSATQTFRVGDQLLPGTYIAEIFQGGTRTMVKLVKQR
jgi:hypothetical protein